MSVTERDRLREDVLALAALTDFNRASLVPILRMVKDQYRGVDGYAMQIIADALGIHPVEVHAVATFYSFVQPKTEGRLIFRLCRTLSCELEGKERIAEQLTRDLGIGFGETSSDGLFTLEWANCMGMCDQGPAMLVNETVYARLTPERAHAIVEGYRAEKEGPAARTGGGVQTVGVDVKSATNDLTFAAVPPGEGLGRALAMSRVDIIDMVHESKLKGRGGAGFPTGTKWNLAAAEQRRPKYVICNADEGEPGTFKDRLILTEFPDLVFDGMTIGARAIGASLGLVYLRAEYGYLRGYLQTIIAKRREAGLLGRDIGGIQGFNFDILVAMGAGAYVCGEETALLESLEGFRAEPRNRPPFPAVSGFLNRPSVINNVETLAWAACILARGVEWFKRYGTHASSGHKLFSVSGDCRRPGVYEFPFGLTVGELLREVGGEEAKAVQVGGASGRCLPPSEFSCRLAFEDVSTGGSVMVFGPKRDMLSVARNLLEFFVDESCGQCTPCRLGNGKLLEGVEMLREGTCSLEYLNELTGLARTMQVASKCGLGQTSPVALLSILEHFEGEILGREVRS